MSSSGASGVFAAEKSTNNDTPPPVDEISLWAIWDTSPSARSGEAAADVVERARQLLAPPDEPKAAGTIDPDAP